MTSQTDSEPPRLSWPSTRRATAVNSGLWAMVALWSGALATASARVAGSERPWMDHFLYYGGGWVLWPFVTWGLYRLAKRHPLDTRRWKPTVLRLVLLGLAWTALQTGFMASVQLFIEQGGKPEHSWWNLVFWRLHFWAYIDFLIYTCVAAAMYGLSYFVRYQQEVQAASRLRQHIAQAELRALQSQLHPHFLFNALNSVSNLIRVGQRDESLATLARLSDLLRDVLGTRGNPWRTLRDELDFVAHYVAIQSVRFGDRLDWRQQVDADCLDVAVPSLLLQPLVENAIQHGVAPRPEHSRVELQVRSAADDTLLLDLSNPVASSAAMPPSATVSESEVPSGHGLGLQNVLDRLALLYPGYSADDLLSCRTHPAPDSENSPATHRWHVQIRLPPPPSRIHVTGLETPKD